MILQQYRRAELEHPDTFITYNFSVFVTEVGATELLENADNKLQLHIKPDTILKRKINFVTHQKCGAVRINNLTLCLTVSMVAPGDTLGLFFQTDEGNEYGWMLSSGDYKFVVNDDIMYIYQNGVQQTAIEIIGTINRQVFLTRDNKENAIIEFYDIRHSATKFDNIPFGGKVIINNIDSEPDYTNNGIADKTYSVELHLPKDDDYYITITNGKGSVLYSGRTFLVSGAAYLVCKYNIEVCYNDEIINHEVLLDYNVAKLTIKNLRAWNWPYTNHYRYLFITTEAQSYIEDTILYSLDDQAEEWHRELRLPILLSRYTPPDEHDGSAIRDEDGYYPVTFYVKMFSRNPDYTVDNFTMKVYEQTASNYTEGEYEDGYDYLI